MRTAPHLPYHDSPTLQPMGGDPPVEGRAAGPRKVSRSSPHEPPSGPSRQRPSARRKGGRRPPAKLLCVCVYIYANYSTKQSVLLHYMISHTLHTLYCIVLHYDIMLCHILLHDTVCFSILFNCILVHFSMLYSIAPYMYYVVSCYILQTFYVHIRLYHMAFLKHSI